MTKRPTIPVFAYNPGGNKDIWIAYWHGGRGDMAGVEPVKVAMVYDEAEADSVVTKINTDQLMPDGSAVRAMKT